MAFTSRLQFFFTSQIVQISPHFFLHPQMRAMLLSIALICASLSNQAVADDFSTVGQRLYESFMPPVSGLSGLYEKAKEYNANLNSAGYWPDISM